MDEYLWPARNVAEYAYCPRLFYLMEVEGLHLPSVDTEQGQYVHRNVDKVSIHTKQDEKPEPERPKVIRSLTITSKELCLTATLDLAEILDGCAVPVEYRKGRPHRPRPRVCPDEDDGTDELTNRPEPWPTDLVQVGLQSVLLESAGYRVPHAILYYATEKLRLQVDMTDDLKRQALEALSSARACAAGPRPLPLVNDPRCPGCSMNSICLPDEVRFNELAVDEEWSPRKIWPPRDDGIHVVAQTDGTKVGVRGECLRFSDREGKSVKEIPIANTESLSILGSVQVTTQAIHALATNNVPVAFLTSSGRLSAMLDPCDSVSALVRRAQVRATDDESRCLELSKALISAKISNQRTMLMRNHPNLDRNVARDLSCQISGAAEAANLDVLRGHEGQAAAVYFRHFGDVFKGDEGREFAANGRQRRPPPDPVNACISFGYSMLANECVAALRTAGLEPSVGAFHVYRPGRPALALDLMEPFRPLIVDSVAVMAFNRGELVDGHFLRTASGCAMTDHGRKAFFSAWGRRMDTEVKHQVFDYRLSYRRMIILHARLIAARMLGEIKDLAFLTTR